MWDFLRWNQESPWQAETTGHPSWQTHQVSVFFRSCLNFFLFLPFCILSSSPFPDFTVLLTPPVCLFVQAHYSNGGNLSPISNALILALEYYWKTFFFSLSRLHTHCVAQCRAWIQNPEILSWDQEIDTNQSNHPGSPTVSFLGTALETMHRIIQSLCSVLYSQNRYNIVLQF